MSARVKLHILFIALTLLAALLSFLPIRDEVGGYFYLISLGVASFGVLVSIGITLGLVPLRDWRFAAKAGTAFLALAIGRFTTLSWPSWNSFPVTWALAAGFLCFDWDDMELNIPLFVFIPVAAALSAFDVTLPFGLALLALIGLAYSFVLQRTTDRFMALFIGQYAMLGALSCLPFLSDMIVSLFIPCVALGLGCMWPQVKKIHAAKLKNEELLQEEMRLNDIEEHTLREEIRPHFLLNALNNVRIAYQDSHEEGRALLQQLIELESLIDEVSGKDLIPLSDELRIIDGLVALFAAERKKAVRLEVHAENLDLLIPPMLLEPLVENSLQHSGILNQEGGTVRIHEWEEDGFALLSITDNGQGQPIPSSSRGIGLSNVLKRVELLPEGHVDIDSSIEGTRIDIRFALKTPDEGV